jgi:hypothetical protein
VVEGERGRERSSQIGREAPDELAGQERAHPEIGEALVWIEGV